MFRKILLCTDLSPASDALVQCVEELKRVGMEEVVLTHAIPYADAPLSDEARLALDRQRKMLVDQGVDVTLDIPAGPSAAMLAEEAERHDASVIFIGANGKGILQATALGSVSTEVLHKARRPVLLARMQLLGDGKSAAVCGNLFTKVLFPTDFSKTAEKALGYLATIVKETDVAVTLLHVMNEKHDPEEGRYAEEAARYLLDAKKRRLGRAMDNQVTVQLLTGKATKEVVTFAQDGGFSFIVMGLKEESMIREMLMGSVAHEVARHAAVPVLFVPPPD